MPSGAESHRHAHVLDDGSQVTTGIAREAVHAAPTCLVQDVLSGLWLKSAKTLTNN